MKTNIQAIFMILFLAPFISAAQVKSPVEKVYEKYAGQTGFTSVNVTRELFQMIMQMEVKGEGTEEVREMQNVIGQLEGLKVLTFKDSVNPEKVKSLYNEFAALFPSATYTELMSIKENGNHIRFLTKQASDGKILEMVMLAREKNEVTLLSLAGRIDMATISEISRKIKIQGMENLQKMKEHKSKKP